MKITKRVIISSIIIMMIPLFSFQSFGQQAVQQKLPDKTRILFLFDASGSMLAQWENELRIHTAKRILSELVDSLKVNSNLELALRVYGHQFFANLKNCTDSKLEVPFSKNNHDLIKQKLIDIKPKGTTPIAYSLEQSAKDFPPSGNARNIIIIITDGIESCDGDPCAVSKALQKKNIFLKPFVIGLGMNQSFEEQFGCVGNYFDATDVKSFKKALNDALTQTLKQTTVRVELLDINDQPKETDVNVTFINNATGLAMYEFVHYRDEKGRPDSVEVEPVLSYDLVINTIPAIRKNNIELEGGKHNVIAVKTPQGWLSLKQNGASEYAGGVRAIVRKTGDNETINIHDIALNEKYLVGSYDIEVLTLPRTYYKNVIIEQSKTTTIDIPAPGVVNVITTLNGIGSLYKIDENGEQWISNLSREKSRMTFAIQPGKYKLVFRANTAKGSKFTVIRNFEIKSGSSISIKLFGI